MGEQADDPRREGEDYEPPQVQDIPAQDGPAATAAGTTGGLIG